MVRRAIQGSPELTEEQVSQIEMHSVLNLVNVIVANLSIAASEADEGSAVNRFDPVVDQLVEIAQQIRAGAAQSQIVELLQRARLAARGQLSGFPAGHALMRLFDVLDVRLGELLARRGHETAWVQTPLFELFHGLEIVFETMAYLSNSRYDVRMVMGSAQAVVPDSGVYTIVLDTDLIHEGSLCAPAVFPDTVRDLLANARKYSEVGSVITARIVERVDALVLTIEDEGRGIPESDIESVAAFGFRGGNTHPGETKGGGFGLTKAWWLAHTHGGSISVASSTDAADHGTTIEIRLPRPQGVECGAE